MSSYTSNAKLPGIKVPHFNLMAGDCGVPAGFKQPKPGPNGVTIAPESSTILVLRDTVLVFPLSRYGPESQHKRTDPFDAQLRVADANAQQALERIAEAGFTAAAKPAHFNKYPILKYKTEILPTTGESVRSTQYEPTIKAKVRLGVDGTLAARFHLWTVDDDNKGDWKKAVQGGDASLLFNKYPGGLAVPLAIMEYGGTFVGANFVSHTLRLIEAFVDTTVEMACDTTPPDVIDWGDDAAAPQVAQVPAPAPVPVPVPPPVPVPVPVVPKPATAGAPAAKRAKQNPQR